MAEAGHGGPVPDFVRLHAAGRPDSAALVDASSGRRLSYGELDRELDLAVTMLRSLGVEAGSRVAALSRNSLELIVLQLACARAGAILAPLNWRLSTAELRALLEDCAPTLLFGDDRLAAMGKVDVPILTPEELAGLLEKAEPAPEEPGNATLPSLMLYTSGTSGRPKGVLLTEANLFATAVNFSVIGEVSASSAFLVDSPMFHVIGMVANIRPALLMGAKIVVSGGFDPAVTLDRLADPSLGITHYFCVPQMAEMLRSAPGFDASRLRGLKAIFTGGAPHPAARIREWLADGIPIVDGYGMTETGTVLGMPVSLSTIGRKAGSAGLLPPTLEHRLVRDDGSACAPGEAGELLLRGPNICVGYWRNPAETEKAFTDDGYLRTGDIARRDEDGFFYLVDRKKEMFISGGENVYPAEIEAVLKSHPGVAEAAVVAAPDQKWGEVGHAFVLLRRDAEAGETALRALCEQGLARYKHPRTIRFLEEMPRTGSGKVLKAELRKLLDSPVGN